MFRDLVMKPAPQNPSSLICACRLEDAMFQSTSVHKVKKIKDDKQGSIEAHPDPSPRSPFRLPSMTSRTRRGPFAASKVVRPSNDLMTSPT